MNHRNTEQIHPSFTEIDARGVVVNWWSPRRTGDWSEDCRVGRQAAQELARFMGHDDNPGLLELVVKAMPLSETGGVEVGFLAASARLMVAGACR